MHVLNSACLGYEELGLCDSSDIALYILWYQLTAGRTRAYFPCLVRHKSIIIGYNVIASHRLQYHLPRNRRFENSVLLVLQKARTLYFQVATSILGPVSDSSSDSCVDVFICSSASAVKGSLVR